ncbi:MAG: hypothetical protein A2063_07615 [Gallionellales bacterium GWA2_60_142]|nr:MAG: hypothetical protein A2063_07615 [Gallionellales bacterium GWA2_60_142]HCI12943.1 hypothetical protein [Gallionellaceae bacterium]
MAKLTHIATLIYYDGHQLVIVKDEVDTYFLCILTGDDAGDLLYCSVAISRARYSSLINNQIDVRDAFVRHEAEHWYQLRTSDITSPQCTLHTMSGAIPENFLPDVGLMASPPATSDELVFFSKERNNIVSEISVEPPEASEHNISAKTLSLLLDAFQGLVKRGIYATRKRQKSAAQPLAVDAHIVDVCAFVPGSFKIRFESRAGLDLIGDSDMESALGLIEKVLSSSAEPEKIAAVLEGYKGHFVTNLIKLLRVASENKTYLKLSWAKPSFNRVRSISIEHRHIPPLLALLTSKEEMLIETIVLVGLLKKADVDSGAWRIKNDDDGKEYSGSLHESGLSLSGLKTDSRYKVVCIERIEEAPFTGKETVNLYATKFELA